MDSAFNQPTSTTPRGNWQLDQCYREGCKLERELTAATEQRDRLAEALREIADCDFVITLPDRMDAVRAIAREALGDIKWHKL
jgi:hypothetical protein